MSIDFDFSRENSVWLRCDKQYLGKTLVRKGKRLDLPETKEKEPKWVFCAAKEKNRKDRLIPNALERVLTLECEKCPHFKGYQEHQAQNPNRCTPKRLGLLRVTKEMIQQATQKAIEEEKQWLSSEAHD